MKRNHGSKYKIRTASSSSEIHDLILTFDKNSIHVFTRSFNFDTQ
jgi:hypothetical protein